MITIKFYDHDRYSFSYQTSDDYFKPTAEEIRENLNKYIDKKVTFSFTDYWGSTENVEFWVSSWKEESVMGLTQFFVDIKCSSNVPTRFYPSLLQIGKELGLFAPIGYQIIQ